MQYVSVRPIQFAIPDRPGEHETLPANTKLQLVLGEQLDWRSREAMERRADAAKGNPTAQKWQVFLWNGIQRLLRIGPDVIAIPDGQPVARRVRRGGT